MEIHSNSPKLYYGFNIGRYAICSEYLEYQHKSVIRVASNEVTTEHFCKQHSEYFS